jgi:hypothetical protein
MIWQKSHKREAIFFANIQRGPAAARLFMYVYSYLLAHLAASALAGVATNRSMIQ